MASSAEEVLSVRIGIIVTSLLLTIKGDGFIELGGFVLGSLFAVKAARRVRREHRGSCALAKERDLPSPA